jgi:hypothetical protein
MKRKDVNLHIPNDQLPQLLGTLLRQKIDPFQIARIYIFPGKQVQISFATILGSRLEKYTANTYQNSISAGA